MVTLLEITVLILILADLGLAFLYRANSEDIKELEEANKALSAENTYIKARIKVIEKRFHKMSEPADKLLIVHKYDDEDAPGYKDF